MAGKEQKGRMAQRVGKFIDNAVRNTYTTYDDDTDEKMPYARWSLRLIAFLAYAGMALALFVLSIGKSSCFVQNTYKQEFLSNVLANPFYSSLLVVNNGPRSMYEVDKGSATPFKQKASDIVMFPVIHLDPISHSAFWPVKDMPSPLVQDNGVVMLPAADKKSGVYYYNRATGKVEAEDVPYMKGTGPILALMATQSVSGPVRPGSFLPNIGRCVDKSLTTTNDPKPEDVGNWMQSIMRVSSKSHLRGTCIHTGQQDTVDITSNYRTSLTMFSSVNMLFMLTVVLWISASFALFYIGGIPAAANTEVSEIESSTEPDDCNIVCCAVVSKGGSDSKRFTTADATIIISIAWNAALIIYVMIPKIQSDSNIPLNNVVLTIFSALAAIAVQWHWAYYSGKEHIQKNTNSSQEEAPASDGITEGYEVYRSRGNSRGVGRTKPIGSNDDDGYFDGSYNNKGPYRQERLKSMDSAFHTTNFLSVASKKMEQQSLLSKMTAMGYSQQEIMVELGAPFASQNYYRSIKRQMHLDTVQCLEYAITTPLMSAILLSSFSPTVPTGVVQLLYIMMLTSHLLCIPVLYLSNMYKRMNKDYGDYIHPGCLATGVFLLLGACYVLQINAIVIKLIFFRQLWDSMYQVDSLLQATTILMVVAQACFLLAVFMHSLANVVFDKYMDATTVARYGLRTYMVINFVLKFAVGWLAFYTARNKAFPAYACGTWASV